MECCHCVVPILEPEKSIYMVFGKAVVKVSSLRGPGLTGKGGGRERGSGKGEGGASSPHVHVYVWVEEPSRS